MAKLPRMTMDGFFERHGFSDHLFGPNHHGLRKAVKGGEVLVAFEGKEIPEAGPIEFLVCRSPASDAADCVATIKVQADLGRPSLPEFQGLLDEVMSAAETYLGRWV